MTLCVHAKSKPSVFCLKLVLLALHDKNIEDTIMICKIINTKICSKV